MRMNSSYGTYHQTDHILYAQTILTVRWTDIWGIGLKASWMILILQSKSYLPWYRSCILTSCVPCTVLFTLTMSSLVSCPKAMTSSSSSLRTLLASRIERYDVTGSDTAWRFRITCWSRALTSTRSAPRDVCARHTEIEDTAGWCQQYLVITSDTTT